MKKRMGALRSNFIPRRLVADLQGYRYPAGAGYAACIVKSGRSVRALLYDLVGKPPSI